MVGTRSQSKKTPTTAASPAFSSPERPPRPASSVRSSAKSSAKSKARSQKSSGSKKLSASRTIYSSDDHEFSDADSLGGGSVGGYQSSGSAARSVKSTDSQREKIPLNIEKKLLADIEAAGGLYSFPHGESQALDKLFNDSDHRDEVTGANLFGERGDAVRRKLRRRVNYLRKEWTRDKYYQHLSWLQLQPFANIKKAAKQGIPLPNNVPSAVKSNAQVPSFVNVAENQLPGLQSPSSKRKAPPTAGAKQPLPEDHRVPVQVPSFVASAPASNPKMNGKFLPPKCTGAIHNIGRFSHFLLVC